MTRYRRTPVQHAPARGRGSHTLLQRFGGTTLAVAVFAIAVVLGLLYVNQANTVATSGLAIRDLERTIGQLQVETQDLDLRAAALRSLTTIEQSSKDLRLLVRAKADYLPAVSDTVARNE